MPIFIQVTILHLIAMSISFSVSQSVVIGFYRSLDQTVPREAVVINMPGHMVYG